MSFYVFSVMFSGVLCVFSWTYIANKINSKFENKFVKQKRTLFDKLLSILELLILVAAIMLIPVTNVAFSIFLLFKRDEIAKDILIYCEKKYADEEKKNG